MAAEERTYKSIHAALAEPEKVRRLNLSGQNLTTVPPEIARLSRLYHLNLSANRLTQLPPSLCTLTTLEELLLQNNQLTGLPAEINRLVHLRELYLGHNLLRSLPDLSQLNQLEILILRGNPLPPPELERLKQTLPGTVISF